MTCKHTRFGVGVLTVLLGSGAVAAYMRVPNHHNSTTPVSVTTGELKNNMEQRGVRGESRGISAGASSRAMRVSTSPDKGIRHAPKRILGSSPRGNLYGTVVSYLSMDRIDQAYWGGINPATGVVTPLYSGTDLINGHDYDIQTGAVRNGILYTPVIRDSEMSAMTVQWNRRNIETGEELTPIMFGSQDAAFAYSMCYDPDDDVFHLMSLDSSTFTFGMYAQVDPTTWKLTTYGKPRGADFIGAIGYNPGDGQVYAISANNEIFIIDETGGSLINVGYVDDSYPLVTKDMSTAMTYSPLDGAFAVMYADNNEEEMKIVYLDPETGEVTEGAVLSPEKPFFSCLWSPDAYAVDEAPELPARPVADFDGASLTGTLTFTLPLNAYDGTPIDASVPVGAHLTVDGETVYSESSHAGETHTVTYTGTEGVHVARLVCNIGDAMSPTSVLYFYTGNDVPEAPSGVTVGGNILKWNAVGGVGLNNGYVESAALTYDVTLNGVRLNDAPIRGTTFTLDLDHPLEKSVFGVTATANGQTSHPGVFETVLGHALDLPWKMLPSEQESTLFTTLDANRDGLGFTYGQSFDTGEWLFELFLGNENRGNDWLFLPVSAFADENVLYNLTFGYSGSAPYDNLNNLKVCLGTAPDPSAMTTVIYQHSSYQAWEPETISTTFPVPHAGNWYIGFHCTTNGRDGSGVRLWDFALSSLSDRSSAAPADAAEVKFTPAPLGALSTTVSLTAPTLDLMGRPLPADDEVTFDIVCGDCTAQGKALPGEVAVAEIAVPSSGFNSFEIVPSNKAGKGLSHTYSAYVGKDRPKAPANVRFDFAADNKSVTMSWDTPSEVGVNGGYVDTTELTYPIFTLSGITTNQIDLATGNSYTFTPSSAVLSRYQLAPAAINGQGLSPYADFTDIVLGTPWTVPLKETFGSVLREPLFYITTGEFANTDWTLIGTLANLGTGAIVDCNGGCLNVVNNVNAPSRGEVVLPKVSTLNVKGASFSMRWLDWSQAGTFSVWGRHDGAKEFVEIGSFTPRYPATAEWRDETVYLPAEFNGRSWVEFRIRANFRGGRNEMGFIDSYSIEQNAEHDLKLASITGPGKMSVGESTQVLVTAVNAGSEIINGRLRITVADASGKVYTEIDKNIARLVPIATYQEYVDVEAMREYLDGGKIVITATVTADDDEIPSNDSMVMEISVDGGMAPVVGDLTAAWDDEHTSAVLNWSEPSLSYGGYDSFEYVEPFVYTENLGMWRNLDLDGRTPFLLAGLTWPDYKEAGAWQPIDAAALNLMYDERLAPHSGKMYLMARAISVDISAGEEPVQASDWLISPEVVPGTFITFWYGTIDPSLTEYVELWVSETDRNPENFKVVRTFSKEGDATWEEVSFPLPGNAKYFALVYRSFDSFGAMLDDISFTPARLEQWVVDHYTVVRTTDGVTEDIARVTDATSYVDINAYHVGNDLRYRVRTAVKVGDGFREGPASNTVSLEGSAVDDIRDLTGVRGGYGVIEVAGLAGETLAIYGTDGKYLRSASVASDHAVIPSLPGIYIVKCGNAYGKVLVK